MIARLRQSQLEIALGLCDHPAATYEDYTQRVGEYQGLGRAIAMLEEENTRSEQLEKRR